MLDNNAYKLSRLKLLISLTEFGKPSLSDSALCE